MPTVTINSLPGAGYVSAAVYQNGQLKATILSAAYYSSGGTKSVTWDGNDNQGSPVTGTVSVEALYMPGKAAPDASGHPRIYKAKFIGRVGVNVPVGTGYWEHSVGGHSGQGGVAWDTTGIYLASRGAENVPELAKFNHAVTTRTWSAWAADNRPSNIGGDPHGGSFGLSIMDGEVYRLHKNLNIYIHGVADPNIKDQPVGIGSTQNPSYFKGRYLDVQFGYVKPAWGGRTREYNQDAFMDCAGGKVWMSYGTENLIRKINKTTGVVEDTFTVTSPRGLSLESDGNLLVCSGTKVVRVNTTTGIVSDLITGLNTPRLVAANRITGGNNEILVYEAGTQQTVKRFTSAGVLIQRYGRVGGQLYGKWSPRNFKVVTQLAWTDDGFLASMDCAPYRSVWVLKNGKVKHSFFTNKHWIPSLMPDIKHFGECYMTEDGYDVGRYRFNKDTGEWALHSMYKYVGLAGLVSSRYPGTGTDGIGGGNDCFILKRHGNKKFLCRRTRGEIFEVDDVNYTLKLVANNSLADGGGTSTQYCDTNGDGSPGTGEQRSFAYGRSAERCRGFWHVSQSDFTMFSYNLDNKVRSLPVTSTTASGIPRHRDINIWTTELDSIEGLSNSRTLNPHTSFYGAEAPEVFEGQTFEARGTSYYEKTTQNMAVTDEFIFFAATEQCKPTSKTYVFNGVTKTSTRNRCAPDDQWGLCYKAEMHVYDRATKTIIARVGKFTPRPKGQFGGKQPRPAAGLMYSIKQVCGAIVFPDGRQIVVANDFDGGWSGEPTANNYAWNNRGLWVGGMFNFFDTSTGLPAWRGCHNSENGVGQYMYHGGKVYCFTAGENDGRIYEIEGFDGWVNLTGSVSQ